MSTLPENWQSVKSGDICEYITSGSRDWKSYYSDHGPLFIRTQDINQDRLDLSEVAHVDLPQKVEGKRSKVKPGDLLVTITGANVGRVALVPNEILEAYVSQSVGLMRLKDSRNGVYLHYYLQSDLTGRKGVLNMVYGIGRPVLSLQNLNDIPIALPPLPEQIRIVAEIEKQFTRLDAGVAALRRVQANLKRYRAAVLKAAYEGKLVPTETGLRRKEKSKTTEFENGAELLTRILGERRRIWQGRGKYEEPAAPGAVNLPQLPEGWAWASIAQILKEPLCNGISVKGSDNPPGVRALRLSAMSDSGFNYEDARFLPLRETEVDDLWIREGDFFMSRGNGSLHLVGRGTSAQQPSRPTIFPDTMIRLRLADSVRESGWVRTLWPSRIMRSQIEARVKTTAGIYKIAQPQVEEMIIPLPPLAEQARIVAEVERRLSVVEELERVVEANLQLASRLRQAILQKAFRGELVMPEPGAPLPDLVPPLKPEHVRGPHPHFARAILSGEIVNRLWREPTFGRTKHQKIFHLCEHIAQIKEIAGQYHREKQGPLDNKLIYATEAELKKQKWYEEFRRDSFGHAYRPLAKAGGHRSYMEKYWPEKLETIEKLIELMRTWTTERCEIFCTVYTAWNDLIIWGKEDTEDAILHEVLNCWHDSKRQIGEDRWRKAIRWIKEKEYAPTGFGKPTVKLAIND